MSSGGPGIAPTPPILVSSSETQAASRTSPAQENKESQNIRHKMRPPGFATLKNARMEERNRMSKKEKRFDPSRAPIPTRMPEYFNVNLIQHQLPHQTQNYLLSKSTSSFHQLLPYLFSAGEELIAACAHNMEDQVYYLIKVRMSDVNFRSLPTGQTPIMFCSNPRIAEILLKEGAG